MRLLITGANGKVARALCRDWRGRCKLRLLDVVPVEDAHPADEVVRADVADFEQMLAATRGVDAVVHLALNANAPTGTAPEPARRTIDVDMRGMYNVYEAASRNGAGCVVFASSNHVTGLNEEEGIVSRPDSAVRPDGMYAAGKAFGEALGRYYAERRGVRVYCIRIANCNGLDQPGRVYEAGKNRWLSARDAASLFWACIEARDVPFGIFYGVSRGAELKWDLAANREDLGWEPEDDGVERGSAILAR